VADVRENRAIAEVPERLGGERPGPSGDRHDDVGLAHRALDRITRIPSNAASSAERIALDDDHARTEAAERACEAAAARPIPRP
jgi:hypothetical protein